MIRTSSGSSRAKRNNVGACDDGPKGASNPPERAISENIPRSAKISQFKQFYPKLLLRSGWTRPFIRISESLLANYCHVQRWCLRYFNRVETRVQYNGLACLLSLGRFLSPIVAAGDWLVLLLPGSSVVLKRMTAGLLSDNSVFSPLLILS